MIILLYGQDTFRSKKKLDELKEKFIKEIDPNGSSLHYIEGEKVKFEKIAEVISPASLFSRRRMVVIDGIFKNKDNDIFLKLYDYLSGNKGEEHIIIFRDELVPDEIKKMGKGKSKLFDFLSKQKYSSSFHLLSNNEALGWIRKNVEEKGGKISRQAAMMLGSFTAGDLWQIDREIDKLLSYRAGQSTKLMEGGSPEEITEADVSSMVRGSFDDNIFALTEAISRKNKPQAISQFEELLSAGQNEMYLLTMIEWQFKIILEIRTALDSGLSARKMSSELGIKPFIVQKAINQAHNFTIPELKKIYGKLATIEKSSKSGDGNIKTLLSELLANI